MQQVDYIIVGFGLAGLSMAKTLEDNHKSFVVIDNEKPVSSLVAGGFASPAILKRFTPVWQAETQLANCYQFFGAFEKRYNKKFIERFPIYRRFSSVEEQNNWMLACDKPVLEKFLSPKLIQQEIKGINAPFGYGEVLESGRILVAEVLLAYKETLLNEGKFIQAQFNYDALVIEENNVIYSDYKATNIIFAEGYAVNDNPFFKHLLLDGAKGEILIINAPALELDIQLKAGITVLPIGNDNYFVAATFDWNDKTNTPTEAKKEELMAKLAKFLTVPYTVVGQKAGVRPTVRDRRPLVGKHPIHNNLFVLNGLGTRGVMIGPAMAQLLYDAIENNTTLPKEVDCERYAKKIEL